MFGKHLKQELEALREVYARTRQIKESLCEEMLVLDLDPKGQITDVNQNFLSEMGYRREDLIGRDVRSLLPDSFRKEPNYALLMQALTQGKHLTGAFRLLSASGKAAWLRSIWQPLYNSRKQLLGFTVSSSNLTRTIETSKEHEGLINALLRSTAVIEFNLQGEVLTAN